MAIWYVDNVSGNNANSGLSPRLAFLTIQFALSNGSLADGDTIFIKNTGTTYKGPVKLTTKKNITITTSPGNPAIVTPCRSDSGSWAISTGSVYSYTVPGGYVLDSDPLTIYEGDVKATKYTGTIASTPAGSYQFTSGVLYYRAIGSGDPDSVTTEVPLQVSASTPSRWLELSGDCSGLIVENFSIYNCGPYAIYINSSSTNCNIRNVTITRGIQNPIYIGGNYSIVQNCVISNNGTPVSSNIASTITNIYESGIQIENVSNAIIRNNKVDTFVRSGIRLKNSQGNNLILDNEIKLQQGCVGGGGIELSSKTSTNVDYLKGNVIYRCNENAILIDDSSYNVIFGNTIGYNARGILIQNGATLNTLANNITAFGGSSDYTILWYSIDPTNRGIRTCDLHINYDENTTSEDIDLLLNNILRNNLYFRITVEGVELSGTPKFVLGQEMFNFNTWVSIAGAAVNDADFNSISINPDFLDGSTNLGGSLWASATKDDFRPSEVSPVKDAGESLDQFVADNETTRVLKSYKINGVTTDIGAFEVEETSLNPIEDLRIYYTIPTLSSDAYTQTNYGEANSKTSYGGLSSRVEKDSILLFPNVDSDEIEDSIIRYRAIDIKNVAIRPTIANATTGNSPTTNILPEEGRLSARSGDSAVGLYIYKQANSSVEYNCTWEDPSGGYQAAQASDTINPSLSPDFPTEYPTETSPEFRPTTINIEPTLKTAEGDIARIWIKRSVLDSVNYEYSDNVIIKVIGTEASA